MSIGQKRNAKGEVLIAVTGMSDLPDDPNLFHSLAELDQSAEELLATAREAGPAAFAPAADRIWKKLRAKQGGGK